MHTGSVSPARERVDDGNRMENLAQTGPQVGGNCGMGQRAFHDTFKEAMEGGCVEVGDLF